MVLVWHQPATYLGIRFAWNDRFAAFAGVAAPYTTYVKRWPTGVALKGTVTRLALNGVDADLTLVLLKIERDMRNHLTLGFRNRKYVVIEPGYLYPAIVVCYICKHSA